MRPPPQPTTRTTASQQFDPVGEHQVELARMASTRSEVSSSQPGPRPPRRVLGAAGHIGHGLHCTASKVVASHDKLWSPGPGSGAPRAYSVSASSPLARRGLAAVLQPQRGGDEGKRTDGRDQRPGVSAAATRNSARRGGR